MLKSLSWLEKLKNQHLPARGRGLRVRRVHRPSFTVGVPLQLTCTRKRRWIWWSKNRIKWKTGRRSSERVLGFGRGSSAEFSLQFLTHSPSWLCDIATGRLGIEFRAGIRKSYLFWQSAVAPIRRRQWSPSLASGSSSSARADVARVRVP